MKIIVAISPTDLVTNSLLFSFFTNQKQKSGFQQVGGLEIITICKNKIRQYFSRCPKSKSSTLNPIQDGLFWGCSRMGVGGGGGQKGLPP